uniref:Rho guanine nucleotide exchange factor 11 n=1 Tax=Anas platyrhynchos TaxID=8839 RepID=A0A8B9TFT9_ANAPL
MCRAQPLSLVPPLPPLQDPEVQKHATQILRNMLRQEEAELQRFYEAYSRNPATVVEEQIEGARRRVSQLQLKILQETGGSVDSGRLCGDPGLAAFRAAEGRLSLDSQDGDSGLESGTERFPSVSEMSLNRNSVLSDHGLDSPRTSPVITSRLYQHHRRQGSDTPFAPTTEQGSERTGRPLIIGPEEDYDPGYFNNECDSLFQDLAKLKSRPAHLGVFLRYIFSQADPSPLLFYLCADVCQQAAAKDSRGLGKEIWNIFLERNAPLRVKVSEQLLAEIETRLRNGDDVRAALFEAQEMVMPEIQEQIQDYRTKRTMGLGSLYGENDLLDLDGDPQKERQVAEKQLAQLGDILSKYEEDRSSPMAFALSTYMNHTGIRSREPRVASASEKAQALPDKDKWLPFFPKAKKSSSAKKEKDAMEDKKRNPILKYIGKPKISSQSIKPGNVRNIIQHFENNQHYESQEPGTQRLSTGSFPEDLLEADGSRAEVKLGRSESLKGREEMKKSRKAENVPRSRSDVDMDAAAEATRLHQSASSSASSLSTRSLENPTPPYTPKMGRRSIESPSLGFGVDPFLPHLLEDEQGQLSDLEPELDSQNWQHTVGREVLASLPQKEIDRQEVINELFATEGSHLRILRVLDLLFYQRMRKESLLSREELALLFPNLPDVIEIHNSLSESMKKLREEGPIIKEIGDLMLSRFDWPGQGGNPAGDRGLLLVPVHRPGADQNQAAQGDPLPDLHAGSRKQPAVPAPAAQGLDHLRNAAPDQVPAAAGEYPQAHRGGHLGARQAVPSPGPVPGHPQVRERGREASGEPAPPGGLPKTPGRHLAGEDQQPPGCRVQEPGPHLPAHDPRGAAHLAHQQGQDRGPACAAPGGPAGAAAEAGREAGAQVPQQNGAGLLGQQAELQPRPQAQLGAHPLRGHRQASPLHHLHVGAGPPDLRAGGADVLRKKHVDGGAGGCGAELHQERHLPPQAPDPRAHPRDPLQPGVAGFRRLPHPVPRLQLRGGGGGELLSRRQSRRAAGPGEAPGAPPGAAQQRGRGGGGGGGRGGRARGGGRSPPAAHPTLSRGAGRGGPGGRGEPAAPAPAEAPARPRRRTRGRPDPQRQSVSGGGHGWDSVLSSQDSASQELLAEPPAPPQEPKSRASWGGDTSETGPAPEEHGGYKVVRKARAQEGVPEAPPSAGSSQADPELQEGGGARVDGNYFYVSMPLGPPKPAPPPSPPRGSPFQDPPSCLSTSEPPPEPLGPPRDSRPHLPHHRAAHPEAQQAEGPGTSPPGAAALPGPRPLARRPPRGGPGGGGVAPAAPQPRGWQPPDPTEPAGPQRQHTGLPSPPGRGPRSHRRPLAPLRGVGGGGISPQKSLKNRGGGGV